MRNKIRYKRILKSTVYALIIVAAVAAIIATLVLPVLQISGTSMEPTLKNGEIQNGVLINQAKMKTFYDTEEELVCDVNRLLNDLDYKEYLENLMKEDEQLITPDKFKKIEFARVFNIFSRKIYNIRH